MVYKLLGSELQLCLLVCVVHVDAAGHLAIQGDIDGGGGEGTRKSIAPLHCHEVRRKLGYEMASGLRAPLDIDLYREWGIMFQVVLIYYLSYSSEKY